MLFRSVHARSAVLGASLIAMVVSCGKKTSDDSGSSTTTQASSLAVVPDMSALLATSKTTASLTAVTGTPPKFVDIGSSDSATRITNAQKYFSGDVSALISQIQAAQGTLATIQPLVSNFRGAQAKCQLMQDTAMALQILSERTNSSCMMGKVGKKGAGILKYVSGTQLDDGTFFTPADSDVYRQITMADTLKNAQDLIMFKIQGKNTDATKYKINMTYCKSGKALGTDSILVDNTAGTMTYNVMFNKSESTNNGTVTITTKSTATVKANLKDNGDGTYSFDPTKDRTMTIANASSGTGSSAGTQTMNGSMTISDGALAVKLISTGSFTPSGAATAQTNSSKSYGKVQYTGTKFSDAVFYQGAGHRVGGFDDGAGHANTMDQSIGFEYNSSKTPQFDTITSSTYITDVAAVTFATDTLLSQTAPTAPDVSTLVDTDCAATPTSTYTIVAGTGLSAANDSCSNRFGGGGNLCDVMRDSESKVWDALRNTPGAGTK